MTLSAQHLFPRAASIEDYLARVGSRVRTWRTQHGMARKQLAEAAGVSERYLAQLEAGAGNFSIVLLRQLAHAMRMPLSELVAEDGREQPVELALVHQYLERLPPTRLRQAYRLLLKNFGGNRVARIALIGLRGAGKSTLGAMLAKALGVSFIELDALVAREAGASLAEVFSLYGQEGYRRFERRALERVLINEPAAVIAVGGSLVTDPHSYELLRGSCYVIWLRAKPEEHMARVVAQGDLRPMRGRERAMDELNRILDERAAHYALADATLDTSGKSAKQAFAALRKLLPREAE